MNTIGIADEIYGLHKTVQYLQQENARLRKFEKLYNELLRESVQHGEQMMNGWLNFLMSDRVRIVTEGVPLGNTENQL